MRGVIQDFDKCPMCKGGGIKPKAPSHTGAQRVTGTDLIAAERQRQIDAEGFTLTHDASYDRRELLDAARAYLGAARFADRFQRPMDTGARQRDTYWPWDESWWKPSADPIPNLVKAGALIAAEIDRLTQKDVEA